MALQEMGHQQPATPTITDNSSAEGLLNKTMIPKRAKNYDLRFNWSKAEKPKNNLTGFGNQAR